MALLLKIPIIIQLFLVLCYSSNTGQANVIKSTGDEEVGSCSVWADPHLTMFPQRLNAPRPTYWCKTPGENILYQNKWVKFIITVTDYPFLNEKYTFTFFDDKGTLCTIDGNQPVCNNPKIKQKIIGSTIDIIYPAASLRVGIVHQGGWYYDINLYQSNFTIIRQSSGLCVYSSINCELESPGVYRKRNQLSVRNPTSEQLFVSEHAAEICNKYLESARQSAIQLSLSSISQSIEDVAMTSCINDLELTGDKRFATSTLQLSISDTIVNMNVAEDQQTALMEQSVVVLELMTANTSAIIEELLVSENITLDTTTTLEITTATTESTGLTQSVTASTITCTTTSTTILTTTTSRTPEVKGLCNFYGDPHILIFGQRPEAVQSQYWCKTPGQHRILLNEFAQIFVTIHEEAWWIDEFNMTFFKENNTVLCTISSDQQICNNPEIKLTRLNTSYINVLYADANLHISIAIYQYQSRWYDMTVRMPYELIRRSSGLCVTPPVNDCELENSIEQNQKLFQRFTMDTLPRQICEVYLTASNRASIELGVSVDANIRDNSLVACIHDYETTGKQDFGASLINMIIKYGINQLQLNDTSFELYTNKSINIINTAVANASTQVDILLASTTATGEQSSSTSSITSSTTTGEQSSSTSTITSSTLSTSTSSSHPSTTILNCSTSPKPMQSLFVFLICIVLLRPFSVCL